MKRLLLLIFSLYAISASGQQFFQTTPASKQWVDKAFDKLSRRQKIAQLMVIRMSVGSGKEIIFFEKDVAKNMRKYNIGSICLFQGSSVQQADVINRLQAKAKTPLMVCVDGETGLGMRFADVVRLPDQLTIGAISDAELAYRIGKAIGQQCKRAGIQVDYAPVVDINNNPNNPVINFRSLGEDKYKVALLGTRIMKGIQDEGVMACAKHFPGHGDVAVDSHLDLPVITKSMKALDSLELFPFKQMIKDGVGSIMIAHLYIPAIDTIKNQATSLSRKNVTGLLKESLGFKGLTFTDALEMKGVSKFYPQGQAAAQSLIAGNDMLCLPGDVKVSIKKVRKSIRNDKLSWNDIDEKVHKVLLAKYNLGLDALKPISIPSLSEDLNKDVNTLKKEVYENAITLLRQDNPDILPLPVSKKVAHVGIGISGPNHFARQLQENYKADCYYFDNSNDSSMTSDLLNRLQQYDAVILGIHQYKKYPANNFGLSNASVSLAGKIQQMENAISFVFGNPYAVKNFSSARNLVACYEDDSLMHDVAVNLLKGTVTAKGKLPVTVDETYHYGSGIITKNYFPVVDPKTAGLDGTELNQIDAIANNAISKGATPGCVVLVARNGKVGFYKAYGHMYYDGKEPVTKESVYDLASVTKTSATTMAVMKLYEDGKLDIDKNLGDYLPWTRGSNKADLKLRNILLHQAGLVSFIPFYRETIDVKTGIPIPGFYRPVADNMYSIPVAENMYMRNDVTDTLYKRILQSKLGPPNKYVYSDNDFILLGKVVEQITGLPLNEYVRNIFYLPLGMMSTTFLPKDHMPLSLIAPTENEKYFRLQQIRGYVHDPGAAMFGGVAGHAGLFSNAYDLAQLYQLLLNGGTLNGVRLLKKETIDYFTAYHSDISRRGLGFDKPEKDNATSDSPYPIKSVSPLTFGHTGFTGICVWADPKYDLLYIFLSNRVCPDGENNIISKLNVRSDIQEVVYKSIIK
jgi:beta-glucosidase-like glycosyl hydrolase/CubicO group peptidase (beta-lactamase class C family)